MWSCMICETLYDRWQAIKTLCKRKDWLCSKSTKRKAKHIDYGNTKCLEKRLCFVSKCLQLFLFKPLPLQYVDVQNNWGRSRSKTPMHVLLFAKNSVVKSSLMLDLTRLCSEFRAYAVLTIELEIHSAQKCDMLQYTPGNKYSIINSRGVCSITSQWQWTLLQRQRPFNRNQQHNPTWRV